MDTLSSWIVPEMLAQIISRGRLFRRVSVESGDAGPDHASYGMLEKLI